MKVNKIVNNTTNRGEFNRAYKRQLDQTGEISCSRCAFHNGDNEDHKWYGGHYSGKHRKYLVRYPNWKLVSKNKKQWMKKPIKIVESELLHNNMYVEIKF